MWLSIFTLKEYFLWSVHKFQILQKKMSALYLQVFKKCATVIKMLLKFTWNRFILTLKITIYKYNLWHSKLSFLIISFS